MMNTFHVLSLGSFIQAGAHYVHGGPTEFYVVWCVTAGILAGLARFAVR